MPNNYPAIPHEMRFYRQWVVWRYEEQEDGKKPTKVLYNPNFNGHAAVNNKDTWVSFDEAVSAAVNNEDKWAGIGFVLTEEDPYCFIDLDDTSGLPNHEELYERQDAYFKMFESYAELSPSGRGLHIIAKGSVERGRKRAQIEIYSSLRFMTMTGDVYRDAPIVEEDVKCKMLWNAMGGAAAVNAPKPTYREQTEDDERVTFRMFNAHNGDKAKNIYNGHWQQYVSSASEADQALFNIIVFYTKNKEQIVRIFQRSALGTRKKAYRQDYLERSIGLAFDNELPPVDHEGLLVLLDDMRAAAGALGGAAPLIGNDATPSDGVAATEPGRLAQLDTAKPALVKILPPVNAEVIIPPGLVGDIALFVQASAHRPLAAASLVAGIGLVAGIAGRAYNVSGSGLNQYLLFLAPTGTGKEGINNGISKLVSAVENNGSPKVREFIGPGQIKSDSGLIKWIDKANSCLSIVGEFGLKLAEMTGERAPAHLKGIKSALMDFYSKSGRGQVLNATAYSDKDKVIAQIKSPNYCMIGESTQERFYEVIDEVMVYEGLLPRFTLFEFDGDLPTRNKNAGAAVPSVELVQLLGKLVSVVNSIEHGPKGPVDVLFTPEADKLFDDFNTYCESFQRGPHTNELLRGVWSRAWLKAAKLAATVAVGMNIEVPVITIETAQWATKIVADESSHMVDKFATGQIGMTQRIDDNAQHKAIVKVLHQWLITDKEAAVKAGVRADMQFQGCIPHSPLMRRLASEQAFRRQNGSASLAVKTAIKLMLDNDEIRQLPTEDCIARFGTTAVCYMVSDPKRLFNITF